MVVVIGAVFTAAFLMVALVLFVWTAKSSRVFKQTMERLDSISVSTAASSPEEVIDIRREDILSDIPWLNNLMQSFNIFPAIRKLLRQADVDWELGSLVLMSLSLWTFGGLALFLRTGAGLFSALIGAVLATIPWLVTSSGSASKRFAGFREEKLPGSP